jgi:thiamine-monophosphate kinase
MAYNPPMRENDFLNWLNQTLTPHAAVTLGIGDDMAAVTLTSYKNLALLKIDQALDKVHFDLAVHSPRAAGIKAVNRCLSDCAAMACKPAAILLSVALPQSADDAFARELFLGCQSAAAAFDCPIVGGDTAIWDQRLAITVAALGAADGPPVTRSGAKPGDAICVTGALGGSRLGRHMTFTPRIELALELVKVVSVSAMMDLSDGLAMDLTRLCARSAVGAIVAPQQLPIHADAELLEAKDHIPAGLHALADGEDYELLFTIPEAALLTLYPYPDAPLPGKLAAMNVPIWRIGSITAEKTLHLLGPNDERLPWPKAGWEHGSE